MAESAAAVITGAGYAVPAEVSQADAWTEFFAEHHRGRRIAGRIFSNSGVVTRHGVVDPRIEDVPNWGTGQRMRRYVEEGLPLGKAAVTDALGDAGLSASDVGMLAVVSCTGYATPGLDIMLARDLGMDPTVQRLVVGHMGCYAAIPGMGAVSDFVRSRRRPAVMLCVEMPSLHVQPATDELEQIVAHALFSDAASAVVLQPRLPTGDGLAGLEVVDVVALTDPSTSDLMTWDVTDTGFRMGLSPKVPDVLARHVGEVIRDQLLAPHDLALEDVAGWAVHPGGRRILEVVAEQLELDEAQMQASYDVLARFGNCSSATVLLVLSELKLPTGGQPVVAMAFGPGLTLYAMLLRSY